MDININWCYYNINFDFLNAFNISDFDFRTYLIYGWKARFDKTKRKEKLSLTTQKKKKNVSGCRENAYKEKNRLLFSLFRQHFCILTATEREKNLNI